MTAGNEWWRPMPQGASSDAIRILAARGARAFGDGFVALLLPIWLIELGFSAFAIGAIVTSTLIGTAVLTLWIGMIADRHSRRRLLLAAALVMTATGVYGILLLIKLQKVRRPEEVGAAVGWRWVRKSRKRNRRPPTARRRGPENSRIAVIVETIRMSC